MPATAKLFPLLVAMSLVAWAILSWAHLLPWLARRNKRDALLVVVMPHMFRHVGAMALLPGIADVPLEWSVPLAWGDCITAMLAMVSMIALKRSWRHANLVVLVFNMFGILDLLHNGYNAATLQIAPRLGPIAYVVAF